MISSTRCFRILMVLNILDPCTDCTPVMPGISSDRCKKVGFVYRNPSCRRNNARFVPLLQNRIAYDNVLIVAACPVHQEIVKHRIILHKCIVPRIKHPPK